MSEKIVGLPKSDIQTVEGGERDPKTETPQTPVMSNDDGVDAYYDSLREAKRGKPLFEVPQTAPRKTKSPRSSRGIR